MTTINQREIQKFSMLADEWWDVEGKFKPLHMFNPTRIEYILNICSSYFKTDKSLPLKNLKILDIGCGGGLISEPLARLGGSVTGIDASEKNIKVAKLHAKEMGLNINYIQCSPENLKIKKKYDVILNMEVIEHVSDVELFIKNCSHLLKKGGVMFVATINKNLKSYLTAIIGAEYILKWLPIGTHDWNKFLTPTELEKIASKQNFVIDEVKGVKFNFFLKKWYISNDCSVNYVSTFIKD